MANKYNMTAIIKMPLYLQCYIKYRFLNGGNSCDGENHFSRCISSILQVPPKDYQYNCLDKTKEDFEIVLPHHKGKDPLYYNYISPELNDLLIANIEFVVKETLFLHLDNNCLLDTDSEDNTKIVYGQRLFHMKMYCIYCGIPWWAFDYEYWNRMYSRHRPKYKKQIIENKQAEINYKY